MQERVKIGLIGCGAIGEGVSLFLDKNLQDVAFLYALADIDKEKAERLQKRLLSSPRICDIDALIKEVDLVIEAASAEAVKIILEKTLLYKKDVVIVSVGGLISNISLLKEVKKERINIYVPSGAVCAVDGIGALGLGNINKLSLTTSKPPRGLIGAAYLKDKNIDLSNLEEEKVVFKGSVEEAIKYFPKNINVAATLFLASSFENIEVSIKADPKLKRNVHHITVDAEEAKLSMSIENIPSKLNPKTSALTALSIQSLLKKIFYPFKIGS